MDMTVKLQVFEGPLDLLLHLLDKNKVNIYDIPIVEITKQYMDYIREMKRHDLIRKIEGFVRAVRQDSLPHLQIRQIHRCSNQM